MARSPGASNVGPKSPPQWPPSVAVPPRLHGPKPPLYRLSRALRVAGILTIVVILVFMGAAIYSLYLILPNLNALSSGGNHPDNKGLNISTTSSGADLAGYLVVTNPGWFPFKGLQVGLTVSLPSGALLVDGSSPPQDLPSGGVANLTLSAPVDILSLGHTTIVTLLTQSTNLSVDLTLHGVYAYLFSFGVLVNFNQSWGAPFNGLQVALGPPSNSVPTTIKFTNQAGFTDNGSFKLSLASSSGQACGSTSVPLDMRGGGTVYDQTSDVPISSGCNVHGGSETIAFQYMFGPAYALFTESIP